MKFFRLLLILVLFYSTALFSQSEYPEISFSDLQNYSYQIIFDAGNYYIVVIEGTTYIVYLE